MQQEDSPEGQEVQGPVLNTFFIFLDLPGS